MEEREEEKKSRKVGGREEGHFYLNLNTVK